jgi:hypothetical protein
VLFDVKVYQGQAWVHCNFYSLSAGASTVSGDGQAMVTPVFDKGTPVDALSWTQSNSNLPKVEHSLVPEHRLYNGAKL